MRMRARGVGIARGSGGRALTSLGGRDRPPLRPLEVVAKNPAPKIDLAGGKDAQSNRKMACQSAPVAKSSTERSTHLATHAIGHTEHQIARKGQQSKRPGIPETSR